LPRWWKIGFTALLLITTGAFSATLALEKPSINTAPQNEPASTSEEPDESLTWDWSEDFVCDLYALCQVIDVEDTASCPDQISVDVYLTDKNDDWLSDASVILNSPQEIGATPIELGSEEIEFEYLYVGDVKCTTGLPTLEAGL
jgi:hypothetical protein